MKMKPAIADKLLIHVSTNVNLDTMARHLKEAGFESSGTISASLLPNSAGEFSDCLHDVYTGSKITTFIESLACSITVVYVFNEESGLFRMFHNTSPVNRAHHPTLNDIERNHIIETLQITQWHCQTAAKLLGIDRSTLYRKMKRYGISRNDTER